MPRRSVSDRSAAPPPSRKPAGRRAAKAVAERAPVVGWLTSDLDEITMRRWRGRTDILDVAARGAGDGFFGLFQARLSSGSRYEVEIRSLDTFVNACACIDHRVNRLGTCKHIEGVLAALAHRKVRAFREAAKVGSP